MSSILTRSTWSLPCTLALVDVPDVSHRSWSPGLLVPWSKPHVHASPLSIHRHGMSLWPSPHRRPPPRSSTPAQHKPRDMSHT
jgi:hypothetical protein